MGRVDTAAMAGGVVRRVRTELGMSRAALAEKTGIGARTLYALETGESENFGLGNYLRVLQALGLTMSVDLVSDSPLLAHGTQGGGTMQSALATPQERVPWDDLADIWRLDQDDAR